MLQLKAEGEAGLWTNIKRGIFHIRKTCKLGKGKNDMRKRKIRQIRARYSSNIM